VFDNYVANVTVAGEQHSLALFDTAGQEDYDRLRPLSYPETDVFLLCFSVDSITSFANLKQKWLPEIHHHSPGTPIVLVGTKSDLRHGANSARSDPTAQHRHVSAAAAEEFVRQEKLHAYIETSALSQVNLGQCFDTAIAASLGPKLKGQKKRVNKRAARAASADPRLPVRPVAPVMPETGRAPWIYPENATFSRDFGNLLRGAPSTSLAVPEKPKAAAACAPDLIIHLCGDEAEGDGSRCPGGAPAAARGSSGCAAGMHAIAAHKVVLASCSAEFEAAIRALEASASPVDHVPLAPSLLSTTPSGDGLERLVDHVQLAGGDQSPGYDRAAPPPYELAAPADASTTLAVPPPPLPPVAPARVWPALSARAVRVTIEWLYTGEASQLPGATRATSHRAAEGRPFSGTADECAWLAETKAAAEAFGCVELAQYVDNITTGMTVLNPSFTTYVSDRTGGRAASLFAGREWLSDCVLAFADEPDGATPIPAHSSVLAARCPLFNRLLAASCATSDATADPALPRSEACFVQKAKHGGEGAFARGKCDSQGRAIVQLPGPITRPILMAILEFIYRDHVTLGEIGAGGTESSSFATADLLRHAHEFGLTRLVSLCELQLTKVVDAAVATQIAKSQVDVVGMLNLAVATGANQLEAWCLFFIGSNYGPMSQRLEWGELSQSHRRHAEQHQWPPQSYFAETRRYAVAMKKWESDVAKYKSGKSKGSANAGSCTVM
jgi:cell division control protein 42